MLYLPKKAGEFVVINDDIEITVVDTPGRSARLGCVFPQGASVLRQELREIIQKESQESAQVCVDLLVAPMEAPNKAGE
jgi:carbon storage regulator CsrA